MSPEEQVGATTAVPTIVRYYKIYSAEDASVTPPTLSSPPMPVARIEGISHGKAGELELLVGVDGRVEQAQLVPARRTIPSRMMVSAAKTWRFDPATREGEGGVPAEDADYVVMALVGRR